MMRGTVLALTLLAAPAAMAADAVTRLAVVAPPAAQPPAGAGALGAGGLRLGDGLAAALWDDGLAEVAEYDLHQFRYGALHPGSATLIVVREDLDPLRAVKAAGDVGETVPVLKVHLVTSYQTGVYRYEQAATTFLRRADAVPLRLFIGSHEWCGTAAKSWINRGDGSRMDVISYFDGHGDLQQDLTLPSDALLADGLVVALRAWLAMPRAPERIQFVPSQVEARTVSTAALPASLARAAVLVAPTWAGAGGEPLPGTAVMLTTARGEERFVFAAAAPHALWSWRGGDGSTLTLRRLRRFAYWAQHDPADRP